MFYASTCYVWLGDDDRAEEHALEVIAQHVRPDGSTNAPMRVAQSRINLGIVAARRGDLDQAVAYGHSAFAYERRSLTALTSSAADLDAILQQHYQGEHLARDFHERHLHIRRALEARKITSL